MMMSDLQLLVIEDSEKQIETYNDIIEVFNEITNSGVKIIPKYFRDYETGLDEIENPLYDAAIIDLKLKQSDEVGVGNHIIRKARKTLRIPMVIISGYPQDLEDDLKEKDNPFFKLYKKDIDYLPVLEELAAIKNTGITNVLGRKGEIERYLNDIFWNHLSTTFRYWQESSKGVDLEKILLRYTMTHLQEHLDLSDTQEEFERYYPIEVYITPPIKKNHFTGDIIQCKESRNYYIILNPSCDMANGKAKNVTIALIENINFDYVKGLRAAINKGDDQSNEKKVELQRLLTNSGSLKYHFLPESIHFPGGFINFQKLSSIKLKEINEKFERVSSTTDRFSKDIIARFSHYYSRQGQPDFEIAKIMDGILQES